MTTPGDQPAHPSLQHPGRWLWLLLLVPVAIGLWRLRFDAEVLDLLPARIPAVEGLKLYQEHFSNARELILTVETPGSEENEQAARAIAESLRQQTNLVASVVWEPPWQEHPDQMAELVAYLWYNQQPDVFHALAERLAPDRLVSTLAATREELATSLSPQELARLSYDPFGLTQLPEEAAGAAPSFEQGLASFSSPDGTFRIIFVQARPDLRNYADCDRWLRAVKAIVQESIRGQPIESDHSTLDTQHSHKEKQTTDTGQQTTANSSQSLVIGYTGRPAFVAEAAMGMQRDVKTSVGGTAAIIAVLFWLAHRRIKPMLWLLALLALTLGSTLALGGLILGKINVVSIGFAAILLGLAVDYAVVHYQEALAQPHLSIPQIRHAIAPSIFWAAVTTISAFLVLNLGGLPGLGQLGTLVALGVALAACIMIFEFLPPLFPERAGTGRDHKTTRPQDHRTTDPEDEHMRQTGLSGPSARSHALSVSLIFCATAVLVLVSFAILLFFGRPGFDPTGDALRPRNSAAYATLAQIQQHLNQGREPMAVLVGGRTEAETGRRLSEVQSVLATALSNRVISGFMVPTPLWPKPEFENQNRVTARSLAQKRGALRQAVLTNGFSERALTLTDKILDTWEAANATAGVFWPTNAMSRWIFDKFSARTSTNSFVVGQVNLRPAVDARHSTPKEQRAADKIEKQSVAALQTLLPRTDVWLSSWGLLGDAVFGQVKANFWKLLAPMIFLVFLSLWLAFRRLPEIALSLAVLLLSGLCLLAVMRLAHWSWNLLNLMAIPLMLGTGVDYSIFMQLALRRFGGNRQMAYRAVGRALLLCGGTAIAGFGSLAWSSNAGMASLGQICATGIGANMLISVLLLPGWWVAISPKSEVRSPKSTQQPSTIRNTQHAIRAPSAVSRISAPSRVYGAALWRLGMALVRALPPWLLAGLCKSMAALHFRLDCQRREVVIRNLLPALADDRAAAKRTACRLYRNFALKLVDLWRVESGLPLRCPLEAKGELAPLESALRQRRGVLLMTAHVGNWELGGLLLAQLGVKLTVLTLAEPDDKLTELRLASRANQGTETIVIGPDGFAFVEVIKRLQAGAAVAILVDRPRPENGFSTLKPQSASPENNHPSLNLFGRPFAASFAAVELARASGCVLLAVTITAEGNGYVARVLPEFAYEQQALVKPEARRQLMQRLLTGLESQIRAHLDQWYQFVPIFD